MTTVLLCVKSAAKPFTFKESDQNDGTFSSNKLLLCCVLWEFFIPLSVVIANRSEIKHTGDYDLAVEIQ